MSISNNKSSTKLSIKELLSRAAGHILAGESRMRKAAEDIATAAERGATQRQIAGQVGKSVGWVNCLLQWRRNGYQSETPFGPLVQASRERAEEASVQSTERKPVVDGAPAATATSPITPVVSTPEELAATSAALAADKERKRLARAEARAAKKSAAPAPALVPEHRHDPQSDQEGRQRGFAGRRQVGRGDTLFRQADRRSDGPAPDQFDLVRSGPGSHSGYRAIEVRHFHPCFAGGLRQVRVGSTRPALCRAPPPTMSNRRFIDHGRDRQEQSVQGDRSQAGSCCLISAMPTRMKLRLRLRRSTSTWLTQSSTGTISSH